MASEDARDFYFNMIRSYIQGGSVDQELLGLYTKAIETFTRMEMFKKLGDGRVYVREFDTKTHLHAYGMDEAASQLGSMLALGARELLLRAESFPFTESNSNKSEGSISRTYRKHWQLAISVTETCYQAAMATVAKLVPTRFTVNRTIAVDAWVT